MLILAEITRIIGKLQYLPETSFHKDCHWYILKVFPSWIHEIMSRRIRDVWRSAIICDPGGYCSKRVSRMATCLFTVEVRAYCIRVTLNMIIHRLSLWQINMYATSDKHAQTTQGPTLSTVQRNLGKLNTVQLFLSTLRFSREAFAWLLSCDFDFRKFSDGYHGSKLHYSNFLSVSRDICTFTKAVLLKKCYVLNGKPLDIPYLNGRNNPASIW